MTRYRRFFNSAPIAQFHLRYHWIFPRAGDSAKWRAITPIADRARYRARIAPQALCATGALPSATLGSAPLSLLTDREEGKGCIEMYSRVCDLIMAIHSALPSRLNLGLGGNLILASGLTTLGFCLPDVESHGKNTGLQVLSHVFCSMRPGWGGWGPGNRQGFLFTPSPNLSRSGLSKSGLAGCVAQQGNAVQFSIMQKRDDQITLRIAAPLRAELERAAADDGRDLSSLIRKILVDHAARRIAAAETKTAA